MQAMTLVYVIAGLIFAGVAVLVIAAIVDSRAAKLRERVERLQAPAIMAGSPLAQELQRSVFERVIQPFLASTAASILQLMPGAAIDNTRAKLETAGSPTSLSPATFIMLRGLSTIAGIVGGLAIIFAWTSSPMLNRLGVAGLTMAIGAMIPDYLLSGRIRARQYQITKSLPDIIDLLVVSSEAGTGLDGALGEVVRRKSGPLPDEFKRVLTEIRLGKRRNDAWLDLAIRCGVDDLKNLVAALHQAEELGVSISNTLRAQSDSLRTRRSMRIRTAAATLSVKMLFPLIFCIFPSLFVVVLGPGVMSIDTAMKGIGW
jgi:tight adherence protein C